MHSGTKLRNEKKNNFEGFTVLFAGSKVYISDKAYPLGELIDLRYEAETMLSFAEEEFYNPKRGLIVSARPSSAV